ncbi:MAG: DUF4864 domain-containing protein [Rhodobacteraceae bacterium]|nr:DUF4864 domain-containing protein [Paracoccaceae bacterium]
MRQILLTFALILGFALPAPAQEADIRATITAQIEAFKLDDFSEAFTYASPNIRNIFRSPENFGRMVQQGYPMVWRPAELRYLDLREVAGNLWQRVQITDATGRVHLLDYQMIQIDGDWRINGVQLLRTPDVSA